MKYNIEYMIHTFKLKYNKNLNSNSRQFNLSNNPIFAKQNFVKKLKQMFVTPLCQNKIFMFRVFVPALCSNIKSYIVIALGAINIQFIQNQNYLTFQKVTLIDRIFYE